jgi:hypothetical protein
VLLIKRQGSYALCGISNNIDYFLEQKY